MERIKQALEKARAQSHGLVLSGNVSRGSVTSIAEREQDTIGEISYTDTKVISLDLEHLERNRIVAGLDNDYRTVPFDLLRTQLLRKMEENGWRSVAVTSPTPGCGKTMVAINLAFSIARQNSPTVLLADFDLRRPKVSNYLGIQPAHDLADYLENRTTLSGSLINPGMQGLVLLANTHAYSSGSEMITTPKLRSLVKELKTRYEQRLVLFDIPPLLPTDDAIAFLPHVDCAVLVVADGKTNKSEVDESLRLIDDKKLAGIVLNKAESRLPSYEPI